MCYNKSAGAYLARGSVVVGSSPPPSDTAEGVIVSGSKNVFVVRPFHGSLEKHIECRLKGKVFKEEIRSYNPFAPGDIVTYSPKTALIEERIPRLTRFSRWNEKGRASQVLAANIDLVVCLTSPCSPPFRPRFIDRVLLQANLGGLDAIVIMNKCDLSLAPQNETRLESFKDIGVDVARVSAKTGEGIEDLRKWLTRKTGVLIGQSGVGKSTLLNRLFPKARSKTGVLNKKFNRGRHTTVMPVLYECEDYAMIDTPGLRHFIPDCVSEDAAFYMPDIARYAEKCAYGTSCSHTHEKGCAVIDAVRNGKILQDRYDSFLRIREGCLEKGKDW
jgi:ribosome biogenesis GTPase